VTKVKLLPWMGGALLAVATVVQAASADAYRAEARKLAERSGYVGTYALQCRQEAATPGGLFKPGAPQPAQLFDNLYYVGLNSVGAYVLKTSQGLILIDALNTAEDAEKVIVAGMKTLGLEPRDLKYILISHGHGDHYGGAKWLADTYGAHVVASAQDWETMSKPPQRPAGAATSGRAAPNWGAPPAHDIDAADGQVLTLGDTAVTMVLTPGHTPGTLSFIVPVFANGQRHMLAMWGGTAIPANAEAHRQYLASFDHFAQFTKRLGVDVELSNHPFVDDGLARMEQLRAKPRGANPFVIGQQRYEDYVGVLKNCALASDEPASVPAAQ
jgi:metallo-beta-lactamase class B